MELFCASVLKLMNEYSELLKDPRWQRKRLKILERDGFQCLACRTQAETLHVHHLVYTSKMPWDEPDEHLETLCWCCHEMREDFNRLAGGRSALPTRTVAAFMLLGKCYKRPELVWTSTARAFHVMCPDLLPETIRNGFDKVGLHRPKTISDAPSTQSP
jgi:hypothetical protein